MWNESEHPRDDIGRFTEKGGGYEALAERRSKLNAVWLSGRNLTLAPSLENYQTVLEKIGTDEEIEWLDYNDFRNAKLTKEELVERIRKNKTEYEEKKKHVEAFQAAIRSKTKKKIDTETREKLDKIKSNCENMTDSVAQKMIDIVDRYYAAYEKAMESHKYDEARSGYVGHSRSVRATKAETDGKFSAGRAANILGITTLKLKKYFSPTEWHHTGALYNATDYYDISDLCNIAEDLQDEDSAADIRKEYSADSIEKFEAIFGVKIK